MEAKNVINGTACSMAKVTKESEKAFQVTFIAEIYGEDFTIKNQWLAKSLVDVMHREDDVIWFVPKNDWVLDACTKKYCQFVAECFSNVKSEIKTYLSRINSEKIEMVWC